MLLAAGTFVLFELLPVDFAYWQFALVLLVNGLAMGAFAAPNRAGIMNSLPPQHRGAGSGMNSTFQNSAQVLSIGIFFTLVIIGLSATLPTNVRKNRALPGSPWMLRTGILPSSILHLYGPGTPLLWHALPFHSRADCRRDRLRKYQHVYQKLCDESHRPWLWKTIPRRREGRERVLAGLTLRDNLNQLIGQVTIGLEEETRTCRRYAARWV